MTQDNTYNGWTNYATWRVNLEMIDGIDPRDIMTDEQDAYEFGQYFKEYAQDILEMQANNDGTNLVFSYAMAFLQDVNWTEIAKHKLEEYADEIETAA